MREVTCRRRWTAAHEEPRSRLRYGSNVGRYPAVVSPAPFFPIGPLVVTDEGRRSALDGGGRKGFAMAGSMRRISVVMAVRNGRETLPMALESLWRQTRPAAQVVIVDDASDDGTDVLLDACRRPGVLILRNAERQGVARSLNLAIEASDGDYLAAGYDADLTIVDLQARRTIRHEDMASRSGWTPFDGLEATGWPMMTVVRGRVVMRDDEILGTAAGEPVRFAEALSPHS